MDDLREEMAHLLWQRAHGHDSPYLDDIKFGWETFWANSSVARSKLCSDVDALIALLDERQAIPTP